jgi:D-3-phosphoglycerate dehydrogenase
MIISATAGADGPRDEGADHGLRLSRPRAGTQLFASAGVELQHAQCRTEEQLIDAARDCDALLVQYAPVTDRVLSALPRVGIVSRYGAGFDTVDTAACARHGVWLANSPDYGVGEVATHALAMTLALVRHLALYDRDVRAGHWSYLSPGTIRRASDLTVGILGLGRIGKRFAHLAQLSHECLPATPTSSTETFPRMSSASG